MSKKSEKDAAVSEAVLKLREMIKPGDRVYTILRHRAASGMHRVIDLVIAYEDYDLTYPALPVEEAIYPGEVDYTAKPKRKYIGPRVRSIGWLAADAMGRKFDPDRQGIKIGGCGMDMGFALVYDLGRTLWPHGTPKPHRTRNGTPDSDGGYALNHTWL